MYNLLKNEWENCNIAANIQPSVSDVSVMKCIQWSIKYILAAPPIPSYVMQQWTYISTTYAFIFYKREYIYIYI